MIWIEMVCDGCNANPYGETYRKGAAQMIKDQAKQGGWKTIKGKIYCPDCQRILKEESRK